MFLRFAAAVCVCSGVLLNYLQYCSLTHTSAAEHYFCFEWTQLKYFMVKFLYVLSVDRIKVQ